MSEERVRLLLKEFDYDKNTLDDTLDFILMMCSYIIKLKREEYGRYRKDD